MDSTARCCNRLHGERETERASFTLYLNPSLARFLCLSAYHLLRSPSPPLLSLLCLLSLFVSLQPKANCLSLEEDPGQDKVEEGCIEKDVSLSNKAAYKSAQDFVSIVSG